MGIRFPDAFQKTGGQEPPSVCDLAGSSARRGPGGVPRSEECVPRPRKPSGATLRGAAD